jgi:hypothetical protein
MTITELSSLLSAIAGLVLATREFIRAILALLPRKWRRHHTGP